MILVIRDVMRTAHLIAGAIWLGGSVLYLVVITPVLRATKVSPEAGREMGRRFRELVNLMIGVLVLTGVFLIFDRVGSQPASGLYLGLLVTKLVVALTMMMLAFLLAQEARRAPDRRGRLWRLAPRWILWLGAGAFLLGVSLMVVFEANVSGALSR
jgi:putative copper export protein